MVFTEVYEKTIFVTASRDAEILCSFWDQRRNRWSHDRPRHDLTALFQNNITTGTSYSWVSIELNFVPIFGYTVYISYRSLHLTFKPKFNIMILIFNNFQIYYDVSESCVYKVSRSKIVLSGKRSKRWYQGISSETLWESQVF